MLEGQQINQRGNLEDPKIKEPTRHDYCCDVLFCSLYLCISRICCLEKSCHFVWLLGVKLQIVVLCLSLYTLHWCRELKQSNKLSRSDDTTFLLKSIKEGA